MKFGEIFQPRLGDDGCNGYQLLCDYAIWLLGFTIFQEEWLIYRICILWEMVGRIPRNTSTNEPNVVQKCFCLLISRRCAVCTIGFFSINNDCRILFFNSKTSAVKWSDLFDIAFFLPKMILLTDKRMILWVFRVHEYWKYSKVSPERT